MECLYCRTVDGRTSPPHSAAGPGAKNNASPRIKVDRQELDSFQPVRAAVACNLPGDEDRQKNRQHKRAAEGKIHRLWSQEVAQEDQDRRNEESHLDARADGDRHRQVHAVLYCGRHRSGMLGGVAERSVE